MGQHSALYYVGKDGYADLFPNRRHLEINKRPLMRCIERFRHGQNIGGQNSAIFISSKVKLY